MVYKRLLERHVPFPYYARRKLALSNDAVMPLVELGHGNTPVVTIPGAGDGLSTVYESARGLAWFYRRRSPHQRMYVMSRREGIPAGHGVDGHARDYIEALDHLGLGPVILECNSAGGPIGQQIAARRPDLVRGLVLASTAHRMDSEARGVLQSWLAMLTDGRWASLGWDTTVKTYRRAARFSWAEPLLKPLLGLISRPNNPSRMERLLRGVLAVDNTALLGKITCPTLVFGGTRDPIFGSVLQCEMSDMIPNSRFVQAPGYLHGADLESPDYPKAVVRLIAETAS